ncbi:spore germination protein [Sulfobacillus acidophilus TPY]|uniref:Spore germination protein n=1 Tax=Sulfobacillus acidophilus (strain ATCC 700253 / DSM 10332 / NAL) TaxID=679936 RepID=G8TZU0_SULAD|nr:spore germination protein [Sulfobacillus acidophilus TPY]AEW06420.1 Spore germination protein [Sulfobacillus acidophilus DSM 10332]
MKNHRQARISAAQFATMVTSAYLGLGIYYFPRPLVSAAGRSGIYGLWLDGLVAGGLMWLMFRANRVIPTETLSEYGPQLLGKPLGYLIAGVTIAYHVALAISAAILYSFVIGNIFLPTTPIWAIDGAMTVTAAYLALTGTAGLARTLQAAYLPTLVVAVFSVVLAISLIHHPVLLIPSGDLAIIPILKGAYRQFLIFIGFEVSVTLYPYVRDGDRGEAERYSFYALIGVVVVLTGIYEITLSIFGPALISQLRWPLATTYGVISAPGFFISKLGTFLNVLWTIVIVAFLALRLWCLGHDVNALFPHPSTKTFQWGVVIMAVTVMIMAPLIPNAKIDDILSTTYLIPLGLGYLAGVPLLILLAARLRRHLVSHLRLSSESP